MKKPKVLLLFLAHLSSSAAFGVINDIVSIVEYMFIYIGMVKEGVKLYEYVSKRRVRTKAYRGLQDERADERQVVVRT